MKDVVITAVVPENKEKGTEKLTGSVTIQYPENVKEAVDVYGEEAILSNAFANFRVTIQGNIRSGLKKGEDLKSIAARLAGAKMGVATAGAKVDPVEAYIAMFQSATPEKRKTMLADLEKKSAS